MKLSLISWTRTQSEDVLKIFGIIPIWSKVRRDVDDIDVEEIEEEYPMQPISEVKDGEVLSWDKTSTSWKSELTDKRIDVKSDRIYSCDGTFIGLMIGNKIIEGDDDSENR